MIPCQLPMDQETIKTFLPHRDPMLLLHRVTALSENAITAEYDVKKEAPFFAGHFPNLPIMPGVLIIEAAAQAGALLTAITRGLDDEKFIAFSNVETAKFKMPVLPGHTLAIDVAIERIRLPFYKFSGKVMVGEHVASTLKFAASQMDAGAVK